MKKTLHSLCLKGLAFAVVLIPSLGFSQYYTPAAPSIYIPPVRSTYVAPAVRTYSTTPVKSYSPPPVHINTYTPPTHNYSTGSSDTYKRKTYTSPASTSSSKTYAPTVATRTYSPSTSSSTSRVTRDEPSRALGGVTKMQGKPDTQWQFGRGKEAPSRPLTDSQRISQSQKTQSASVENFLKKSRDGIISDQNNLLAKQSAETKRNTDRLTAGLAESTAKMKETSRATDEKFKATQNNLLNFEKTAIANMVKTSRNDVPAPQPTYEDEDRPSRRSSSGQYISADFSQERIGAPTDEQKSERKTEIRRESTPPAPNRWAFSEYKNTSSDDRDRVQVSPPAETKSSPPADQTPSAVAPPDDSDPRNKFSSNDTPQSNPSTPPPSSWLDRKLAETKKNLKDAEDKIVQTGNNALINAHKFFSAPNDLMDGLTHPAPPNK